MMRRVYHVFDYLFKLFGKLWWLNFPIHYLLKKTVVREKAEHMSWKEEADMAIEEQTALRARFLLWASAATIIALLIWAGFTKVDELARGEARVIPSKQVQIVQSLDGGIVTELLVKEGQTVKESQPLIKIDETRAESSLNENRSQYLALLARESRLRALAEGTAFLPPKEVINEVPMVYSQESELYRTMQQDLASQQAVAREQLAQREKELQEAQAKLDQAERSYELSNEELQKTRPLKESGAVSDVDLLRLERDTARFKGERDQTRAQIGRVSASIAEAKNKMGEIQQGYLNKVRQDLNETTAKLQGIQAASVGLKDKVVQATLRAPVNGTVSRLFYNTVGGVIQPGKDVLEIVPSGDALVLEAKISPRDIAFIRPDQDATVKLTAYDYTIYGALDAKVKSISADSIVDDKGNTYYLVKVQTSKSNLGENMPIIPGMVAQVDILTGKKTILSYLLKPILKAHSYALTER